MWNYLKILLKFQCRLFCKMSYGSDQGLWDTSSTLGMHLPFLPPLGPTQGHQTGSSKLERWVPAEVQSHSVLRKMTNQIWNWDFLKFTRILIELGNRRRENRVWWQSSFYTSLSFNNDHIFIMTFFYNEKYPNTNKKVLPVSTEVEPSASNLLNLLIWILLVTNRYKNPFIRNPRGQLPLFCCNRIRS